MDIKDLHNKFLECNSIVDIDSRSLEMDQCFSQLKEIILTAINLLKKH